MPEEIKIIAPLYVMLPRKTKEDKKLIINLNNYRNWHYIISNEAKKKYKEELHDQLCDLKLKTPINLEFRYFKGSERKCDRANVYSIHEKFFCDALVEYGCIPDDSDEYLEDINHRQTKIDKNIVKIKGVNQVKPNKKSTIFK